jgi:pimeloyl-ACP methyl ester carboxylesterase
MKVEWTVFKHGGRVVEGQVFEPNTTSRKLILFCPGFPGAGATVFEQRHAASLVDAGYTLVVLKHNGTRLQGPQAPQMINNASRLMQARVNGETHLGGGPSTAGDWLLEPLTALGILADKFDDIHIIGNSFGALSSMWSLTMPDAPVEKVRTLLLMAGAQGFHGGGNPADVMRIWRPEFVSVARITEKVTLNAPDQVVADIRECYQELPIRIKDLTTDIKLKYLVVSHDELLHLSDTEEFQAAIGGRGEVFIDDIDKAYPDHGLIAHDMPDYPTEKLLEILQG